jgi:serine/threonine protein phosphatase PrpC
MELNTSIASLNLGAVKTATACNSSQEPLDVGTCSDMGQVRENNEDSVAMAPELSLFVLSDGMGGMACGEVASRLTVDTILTHCRQSAGDPTTIFLGPTLAGMSEVSRRLASAIQLANRTVHSAALENGARLGMGATVVAVRRKNDQLSIAHVGDSRVYRLRNGLLERLTQDHSLAAEMRRGKMSEEEINASGLQNILMRAVGVEPQLEVEVREEIMLDGDTILLCSDGLTHELSDKQIEGVLRDAQNAQDAANQLVALANQAGGADNISTIVMRHIPAKARTLSRTTFFSRWF